MSQLTPFGYDSDPKTYDEFQADVAAATDAKNGAAWALGDLYNIGESRWQGTYTNAFDEMKIKYDTLRNYARVCAAFSRTRRVKWAFKLSFGHFDVVRTMAPEDQDVLLDKAVLENLSRDDLRKARHEHEGIEKPESIKTTCKVIDLARHLMEDFGLDENDMIDITAKLHIETKEAEAAA